MSRPSGQPALAARQAARSQNSAICAQQPSVDHGPRRDDERHDNTLIDTARVPALLAAEDAEVTVTSAFGTERLPTGLRVLIGRPA